MLKYIKSILTRKEKVKNEKDEDGKIELVYLTLKVFKACVHTCCSLYNL